MANRTIYGELNRTICVVTNSRADYSRLKTLLQALKNNKSVNLQLFVVGSHLLSNYGQTVKDIEKDGFKVTYKTHTEVEGRVPVTMAKSTGAAITELASAFYNFKPDVVVVHGDRFEALAAATAASMMNIRVAHIQGGEVTGTIDEHIRHAITKLSHIHFPSTKSAKERIIKMGELPANAHTVGCPSSDVLLSTPKISFEELKKQIFSFAKKEEWKKNFNKNYFLVINHPVTTEFDDSEKNITGLLGALKNFDNNILMLWPNIDAGSEKLIGEIKNFEREKKASVGIFPNFPLPLFVNIMRHAKVIIGNSSSGIREACYFGVPVVNVGTRQAGRERGNNVIDASYDKNEITKAIKKQISAESYKPEYIYGDGTAGKKIADILATRPLPGAQKKIAY